MGSFFETTKEFNKFYEMNDAEERIKMNKNSFEAWLKKQFHERVRQEKIWVVNT